MTQEKLPHRKELCLQSDTLLEKAFKTNDPVFKSVLEKMRLHHSLRYQDSLTVWMKTL